MYAFLTNKQIKLNSLNLKKTSIHSLHYNWLSHYSTLLLSLTYGIRNCSNSAQRWVSPVSFPVDLLLLTVINPPERTLAKRTSVQWVNIFYQNHFWTKYLPPPPYCQRSCDNYVQQWWVEFNNELSWLPLNGATKSPLKVI